MDIEIEAPLAGTPASSHAVRLLEPIPRSTHKHKAAQRTVRC